MPAAPLITVALVTMAALVGAAHLIAGDTPFEPSPAALASVGLIALSVVVSTGILIARSRWARAMGFALTAAWLGVVIVSPLSASSVALLLSAAALTGMMAGPWLGRWLRRLPSATGPPSSVTALLIVLVATPSVAGLGTPAGLHPSAWAWSGWSVLLAVALARAVPGSLAAARLIHPLLGVTAGALAGLPQALWYVAVAGAAAALAWRRDVALSVAPIEPARATPVPYPPELMSPEVLAAAGIDDRGRPLEDGR